MIEELKRSFTSSATEKSAEQSVSKHDRKRRQPRHDASTYIRKADQRPGTPGNSPSPKKQKNKDAAGKKQDAAENIPQKEKKTKSAVKEQKQVQPQQNKPPQKKAIPPMPPIIPPPEEEGKMRFTDLELAPEVKAAVQVLGFLYCTEIQKLALPHAIAGKDLAAKAQTGTGKTAAFLASLITRFLKNPIQGERANGTPRALVLAPTRELAIQIHDDAVNLSRFTGLNIVVIFGGMDHEKQRRMLNEPVDILIGTPGRIIDYTKSRDLDLSQAEALVIDEADRMLDMGFIPDVRRIVYHLPRPGVRQTMLFSATLEHDILRLVESWMVEPVFVESEPEHVVTDLIDQRFYAVLDEQKMGLLMYLIKAENPGRMIIFGNRKDKNLKIADQLYSYGENVELLSGDVAQEKRLKVLDRFREGKTRILVATDVAARGIHVDDITHVVNYDLPEQADDYVHRIGRTGRAGEKGISISFVCEYGAFQLPAIEQYVGSEIKTIQPSAEMFLTPEVVRKSPWSEEMKQHHSHGSGNHSSSRNHHSGHRK